MPSFPRLLLKIISHDAAKSESRHQLERNGSAVKISVAKGILRNRDDCSFTKSLVIGSIGCLLNVFSFSDLIAAADTFADHSESISSMNNSAVSFKFLSFFLRARPRINSATFFNA